MGAWVGKDQSPRQEQDSNHLRSNLIAVFPRLRCSRPDKPRRRAVHSNSMWVACQLLAPLGQAQRKPHSLADSRPSTQIPTVIDTRVLRRGFSIGVQTVIDSPILTRLLAFRHFHSGQDPFADVSVDSLVPLGRNVCLEVERCIVGWSAIDQETKFPVSQINVLQAFVR
jgi:hypothetical protein